MLVAPPVAATITPTPTALTIAQAIASSSVTVTDASFVSVPPSGTPNGVSTSTLGGFPIDGADYGILTTGNVSSVDQPGTFASTSDLGLNVRGDTDFDVSILKVVLTVPAGANCLTFNFKFLSEEYPAFVNTAFNDAFIAELDTSDWTTSGSTITAPHNFAHDSSGGVVSIDSTGLGGMSAANGAGTAFDSTGADPLNGGATGLLGAATPVTPGTHSVYLSIFDQGDDIYDSAVFLDNLRVGTVANPATDCVPGATEAAHLTLSKSVVNTGGGTASATDWTLSATGPTTISGHTGDAAITSAAVSPGTYTLAESNGPTGYTAGGWTCDGGTLVGSSLTLGAGQTASCSIANTFETTTTTTTSTTTSSSSTATTTTATTTTVTTTTATTTTVTTTTATTTTATTTTATTTTSTTTPTPKPHPTPNPHGSPGPTAVPTATPVPTPTPPPIPGPTPTPIPRPTAAPTARPTATPAPIVAPPRVSTPSPTTSVPTATPTLSPSASPTASPLPTSSPASTLTAIGSPLGGTPSPGTTAAPAGGGTGGTSGGGGAVDWGKSAFVASIKDIGDISLDFAVLSTNFLLTLLLLLIFGTTSALFNNTLDANRVEIDSWFAGLRRRLAPIGQPIAGSLGPIVGVVRPGGRTPQLRVAAILLLTGLVYGFLSPDFGLNPQSLILFLSLALGLGIVTYVNEGGAALFASRRLHVPAGVRVHVAALSVAVVCVLASRLIDFTPGIVYGFIASSAFLVPAALDRGQEGKVALYPALVLLAVSLIAWLLMGFVRGMETGADGPLLPFTEALLAVVFVGGLEGLFFNMVPLTFMDGKAVSDWSKVVWAVMFGVATFLFWQLLINPDAGYLDALRETKVVVAVTLVVFYVVITLGTWSYFRWRARRRRVLEGETEVD